MTGLPGLKCVTDNVRCSAQPWSSSPTGREHAALQPWGAAQEPGFGAWSCHGMGLLGRGQKQHPTEGAGVGGQGELQLHVTLCQALFKALGAKEWPRQRRSLPGLAELPAQRGAGN